MPAFATPGPIAVTVQVAGPRVRVTASDRTDTVVLVEPINEASRPDVKVAGSVGECELHLASGQAELDRIAALQANISAGEVTIGHIAGRADIDGGAFGIRIGEVEGTVAIPSSGGRAWIGHASADLDPSSGSGGFDIDRADGSVTVTTASGAIRIGRLTRGQAKLMNGSGNIEVGIGEGTAARVDASSERGSVRNCVASQGPATSDAPLSVHARTRHGDIVIQRAAG
jgi:hypothetical protein